MTSDHACPDCGGSGWLLGDDGYARECGCRPVRIRRAQSSRLPSGVPKRFRGVSFERKPVRDMDPLVLREVRAFVHRIEENLDRGRGMWFHGDVGTGKTSLAMLLSLSAERAGRSVAVYSVPRLLAQIKSTYEDGSGGSYAELFAHLCRVDLLHLDDLGAEKKTDWVLEQLYSIVNERWQDEKSIVVTSNLRDLDALREQVGPRTVSRLVEICGDPVPIMGADLRMTSAP